MSRNQVPPNVKIYGLQQSGMTYELRDFLRRSVVQFDWKEITNPELFFHTHKLTKGEKEGFTSLIEFPDGTRLVSPSIEQVAKTLGWIKKPRYQEYDLSIYGSGSAGLSAAVYAASEGLKTIVVEKSAIGGQAGTSSLIENYMGFPNGISGADLAEKARQQAHKFGIEILLLREGLDGQFRDNKIHVDLSNGDQLIAKSNICATGVEYRRLNLDKEKRFLNKGVYYGAGASEGSLCKGQDVFIVGGGNSAGQAAMHFMEYAANVYLVVRGNSLAETLSDYLIRKINDCENIHVHYNSEVVQLHGDKTLKAITLFNSQTTEKETHETRKLFICIGGKPNTEWTKGTGIICDSDHYLVTGPDLLNYQNFKDVWKMDRQPFYLETSVPGSFAAGDVRSGSVKRVASAVGEGAMAVSFVHKYLQETF